MLTPLKRLEDGASILANAANTSTIQLENVVSDPQNPVPNIVNNGGKLFTRPVK